MRKRAEIGGFLLAALLALTIKEARAQLGTATEDTANAKLAGALSTGSVIDPLSRDPKLQRHVTLCIVGRPLEEALTSLAAGSDVDLEAVRRIADQRVTLCVTDQPMWQIMERLPLLLGHSVATVRGYYWEPKKGSATQKPGFKLRQSAVALADERRALEFPQQETIRVLREMRDVGKLTPEERDKYKGESLQGLLTNPVNQIFRDALRDLSNSQIAALVAGEEITLDPSRFPEQVAAYQENWNASLAHQRQSFAGDGIPVPSSVSPPEFPPPAISIVPQGSAGQNPGWSSMFGIHLTGVATMPATQDGQMGSRMPIIDPYRQNSQASTAIWKLASEPGLALDLSPALYLGIRPDTAKDKAEALRRRRDLAELLRALAATTHANMYEEHFVKNAFEGTYRRYPGLASLKGTRGQLLSSICWDFNVQFQKVGDDYYFWSNTWAQDRQGDIPESALALWGERTKPHNGFTLQDRAQIASAFSLPQLRQTFSEAFPDWGDTLRPEDIDILRTLAQLSPGQWANLVRGQTIPLADLTADAKQILLTRYPDLAAKRGRLNLSVTCATPDQFLRKPCDELRVAVVSDNAEDNTRNMTGFLHTPAKLVVLWYSHSFP